MCKYNNPNEFYLKRPIEKVRRLILIFMLLAAVPYTLYAGTTGKLAGRVTDASSGDPVVGANVIIEGTYLGAATDVDGYYYVNNIPPGEYTVVVSSIGFQKVIIKKVPIKIDLTFKLDVKMNVTAVSTKEVVITAQRPLVQKDLTSTSVTVSANFWASDEEIHSSRKRSGSSPKSSSIKKMASALDSARLLPSW